MSPMYSVIVACLKPSYGAFFVTIRNHLLIVNMMIFNLSNFAVVKDAAKFLITLKVLMKICGGKNYS